MQEDKGKVVNDDSEQANHNNKKPYAKPDIINTQLNVNKVLDHDVQQCRPTEQFAAHKQMPIVVTNAGLKHFVSIQ